MVLAIPMFQFCSLYDDADISFDEIPYIALVLYS